MREHGKSGRTFAGAGRAADHRLDRPRRLRVGCHTVSPRHDVVKAVVYTLRFDTRSALYGEFGRFYVGFWGTSRMC